MVSWLAQHAAGQLGLYWLIPLWTVMAAIGLAGLRRREGPWYRDAAVLVLA